MKESAGEGTSMQHLSEAANLAAAIQHSVADELRRAYDEVRATHEEVDMLRHSMSKAQQNSVGQSHKMADSIQDLRAQLDEVNLGLVAQNSFGHLRPPHKTKPYTQLRGFLEMTFDHRSFRESFV